MIEEEKRRMMPTGAAAPMGAAQAPQMMSQPMGMGMGAQAAPQAMGQPGMGMTMGGQLTNPTGMVGMPGMQPNFVEPSTVGVGENSTTIGSEQVAAAMEKLKKYKQGKNNLEQRVIENERWFKLRHWDSMTNGGNDNIKPSSAWLFNCIANKHADAMDNFPAANILPREASTSIPKGKKTLSAVW